MRTIQRIYMNLWSVAGILALLLMVSSCAEEGIIEETPRVITPESQELVSTTLYGRVIDELGAPIIDAEVAYLSGLKPQIVMTDEEGYFFLPDVDNKGRAAYVTIRYQGRFDAFRKYSVLPNRYNYTEIKMLERKVIGTVQASEGGTLIQSDNAKITLPAGGIVDSRGNTYNGPVNVAMAWIDPSADDLSQRMVGDLSGIDSEGGYRSLTTYGMLQVELLDANNQLLNLEKGAEAQLEFPIPVSMQSDATADIPLWSYDEVVGTWVQEGLAIRDGDAYIGIVGHFSSWNVDHMTDPIEIKGQVLWNVEDGTEIGGSYLKVYVCSDRIGRKGGWLCDDGAFRFYNFPKDEEFKIKILDKCGNIIYQETYGPYTEDTDLGKISVSTNENIVKIFGNVLDCDGNVPAKTSLSILQGGRRLSFPVDSLGSFEFSFDFCDMDNASLHVVDLSALLSKTITLDPSQSVIELADLEICDELTDFISISVDGEAERILTPNIEYSFKDEMDDTLGARVRLVYEGEDSLDRTLYYIEFPKVTDVPSTVEALRFIYLTDSTDSSVQCNTESGSAETIMVTVTHFGIAKGDYIEGTFEGTSECSSGGGQQTSLMTITGKFHAFVK